MSAGKMRVAYIMLHYTADKCTLFDRVKTHTSTCKPMHVTTTQDACDSEQMSPCRVLWLIGPMLHANVPQVATRVTQDKLCALIYASNV